MKGIQFPIFKTKLPGSDKKVFKLEDPVERQKYFKYKAGKEIELLREYLRTGTFVGILLGKKNSGKGTYSKLFTEAVGGEHIRHISVGDVVRAVHQDFKSAKSKKELLAFLKERYRGFMSLEEAVDALLGRSTSKLLPTEFTLALVEREIERSAHKAVFIDGFPRDIDQISYSLYFRALIGYRDDPDFLTFIDLPESVIDERMKYRVVCPECKTPRNLKLLRTSMVGYDTKKKEFYLICDNASCKKKQRMVAKEGDSLGIEAIRDRIEVDEKVMRQLVNLEGVPKVYLRNCIPVDKAQQFVDSYEITPGYRYELNKDGSMKTIEEPWVIKDDDGVESYSLLPAPVAVSLIKQTAKALEL